MTDEAISDGVQKAFEDLLNRIERIFGKGRRSLIEETFTAAIEQRTQELIEAEEAAAAN